MTCKKEDRFYGSNENDIVKENTKITMEYEIHNTPEASYGNTLKWLSEKVIMH